MSFTLSEISAVIVGILVNREINVHVTCFISLSLYTQINKLKCWLENLEEQNILLFRLIQTVHRINTHSLGISLILVLTYILNKIYKQ